LLNAIELSQGVRRADHTLYLIALKVYRPPLSERQQVWCEGWASRVRKSIEAGERDYLRDPAYDRLLSVLFPEMASGLAKPFGKRAAPDTVPVGAHWREFKRQGLPERRRAGFLDRQPKSEAQGGRLLDTKPWDRWLKGRDLEAWKKANPEWAKVWFGEGPPTSSNPGKGPGDPG
jgi:hypothetical protein